MKRSVIVPVMLAVGAGVVDVMGDLTQTRRDPIEVVGDDTIRLSIEPALGRNNRRKLGGLEDASVHGLLSHVVLIETIPA